MRKRNADFRIGWAISFALLLLIGLALIFNNQIKIILLNKQVKHTQSAPLIVVMWKNMEAEATFDFDAVEPASSEAVLRAQLSNKSFASDRRRGGS